MKHMNIIILFRYLIDKLLIYGAIFFFFINQWSMIKINFDTVGFWLILSLFSLKPYTDLRTLLKAYKSRGKNSLIREAFKIECDNYNLIQKDTLRKQDIQGGLILMILTFLYFYGDIGHKFPVEPLLIIFLFIAIIRIINRVFKFKNSLD